VHRGSLFGEYFLSLLTPQTAVLDAKREEREGRRERTMYNVIVIF
jgi:hypothetical protein